MVFPIVPIAAVAGAYLVLEAKKKLSGKRVAILGGRRVGKSTLIRFLSTGEVAEGRSLSEAPLATSKRGFSLVIDGKRTKFSVPRDLPGNNGLGLPKWHEEYRKADFVWYLFRADLIEQGDNNEIQRVRSHLDTFSGWNGRRGKATRKIVLIGTWADQSTRWRTNRAEFVDSVISAEPLKLGAVKLGNAPVIVGSLGSNSGAERLIKHLESNL